MVDKERLSICALTSQGSFTSSGSQRKGSERSTSKLDMFVSGDGIARVEGKMDEVCDGAL